MVYFLTEDGNSQLKNKMFPLSKGIRKHLEDTLENFKNARNDFNVEGWKRLNNILHMENGIEYNEMKRLKNFFDNYVGNGEDDEYKLNGGDAMKNWVNNTLHTATDMASGIKQAEKFLRKNLDDGKPEVSKERRTATKSVQGPTKMTVSIEKPSLDVTKGVDVVKFDSVAQTPSIDESNEHKTIVLSESQMESLKDAMKRQF